MFHLRHFDITGFAFLAISIPTALAHGKRGVAYGNSTLANFFANYTDVTWGYNWYYAPNGLAANLEFVPLLWGCPSGPTSDWAMSWAAAVPGYKHLFSFNEPDNGGQANLNTSYAAACYMEYMQPWADKASLGMPAITNGGPPSGAAWDLAFEEQCEKCDIDFANIHYYAEANSTKFIAYVEKMHETLEKPLWITEFKVDASEADQIQFLKDVLPWLDATHYVSRYAYYGVFPGFLINSTGTGLSALGMTYATYTNETERIR